MRAIVNAFYSEPVVALGVIQATGAALAAEGVIAGWIGVLVVAVVVPLQRHFVTPAP